MGLLDFLNSDDAQLGLNMLAAGGPSTTRMSAGQRMAGAVTATNAAKSAQSDAALKKAQLAEALQKTEVEKFGLQRLQDWQKITMGDGTPAMAPAGMSSVPQSGDTSGGLIGSLQGNVAPQGAPQAQAMPSAQGQPAMSSAVPQASSGAFRFGLPGIPDGNSRAIAASMTPSDYLKLYAEKAMPQTDIGKLMAAQGIDPKSALGQQLLQTATAKANYVAPSNIRPGGYTQDITGNVQQFPHVPDGSTAFKDANGQFHIVPVDGGTGAISRAKQAETMGVGEATPTVVYGPILRHSVWKCSSERASSR